MKKKQKEAILISYYNAKEKYEKLADHISHLIKDDPSLSHESLHAIIYRLKGESRLIGKINGLNKETAADLPLISKKNYQDRICSYILTVVPIFATAHSSSISALLTAMQPSVQSPAAWTLPVPCIPMAPPNSVPHISEILPSS